MPLMEEFYTIQAKAIIWERQLILSALAAAMWLPLVRYQASWDATHFPPASADEIAARAAATPAKQLWLQVASHPCIRWIILQN